LESKLIRRSKNAMSEAERLITIERVMSLWDLFQSRAMTASEVAENIKRFTLNGAAADELTAKMKYFSGQVKEVPMIMGHYSAKVLAP